MIVKDRGFQSPRNHCAASLDLVCEETIVNAESLTLIQCQNHTILMP